MSQKIQAKKTGNRRWLTYVWIVATLLVVSLLIYFERTALLYVLATLSVTGLLLIVAFANLGADEGSPAAGSTASVGNASNTTQ
jgi:hypothetical protein